MLTVVAIEPAIIAVITVTRQIILAISSAVLNPVYGRDKLSWDCYFIFEYHLYLVLHQE